MSYLLDTDICSHLIKVGTAAAVKKLEQVAETEVRMSIVTWAELLFGCALRPEATAFNARVQAFAQLVDSGGSVVAEVVVGPPGSTPLTSLARHSLPGR